jgi:type I restriction enzyme S subunit
VSAAECRLGDVTQYIRGITFKPEEKIDPGDADAVVCMRTKNVQDVLDESDVIAVPSSLIRRDELYLREGDVLLSSANSWNLVGKVCQVPRLRYRATAGGFISIVRPRSSVDSRYLFHWLASPAVQEKIRSCARRTTNISNLSVPQFEQLDIPVPTLQEQRRIADILDKADAIRRKRKEAIALTEELLRSTFLEMFGDPLTNPKGWTSETIEELCSRGANLVDGPFGSSLKPEHYVDSGVKVVRNWNIYDDRFDGSEFKYISDAKFSEVRRSEVIRGDVLITTKGTVGDVCVAPDLGGPAVLSASGTVRLRVPPDGTYLPEFVATQMTTSNYKRYLHTFEAGSAQQYLNLSAIKKMRLIRPPIGQQKDFSRVKTHSRAMGAHFELAHLESERLFRSLIEKSFAVRSQ